MPRAPASKRRRLIARWVALSVVATAALVAGVLLGTRSEDPAARAAGEQVAGLTSVLEREATDAIATLSFEDVTESAGLAFRHFRGRRESLLPEDMGSGVAWGDYDDDGDPDLYAVNWAGNIVGGADPGAAGARNALFRNEGDGTFVEVGAAAGVDRSHFGMAATWVDHDGDGDLDLHLTAYGPDVLYRNRGDGTFEDVTAEAGVGDPRFGAGAAWADYDRDGDVDLYVVHYVDFVFREGDSRRTARQYGSESPYTLNPSAYPPQPNALYRNRGDGTFEDVTGEAGVADAEGRGLSAVWVDFDEDGWLDLYTANDVSRNDVSRNGVYRNRGDGTFEDVGASSLAADYRGAMGLAAGDVDGDLDVDLLVTHWIAQENALYRNMTRAAQLPGGRGSRLFFTDGAEELGLGQISIDVSGWATGLADLDDDGRLDLWVLNGHTLEDPDDASRLVPQRMHLFRQQPGAGFFEVGREAGPGLPGLDRPLVGRGGAHADFDGDGRLDLALLEHGGALTLLRNRSAPTAHRATLRLRAPTPNTRALGARVTVRTGERVQTRVIGAGGSYLSQHQLDAHVGLGDAPRIDEVEVRWPDGSVERWTDLPVDRTLALTQGEAPAGAGPPLSSPTR